MSGGGKKKFKTWGLKREVITPKTNDDVHSSIKLCPLTKTIMNTPHMQRLRHLKQLGVSHITYVATSHTRFEHSLGVAELADRLLRTIKEHQPALGISEKDVACVKLAGLLHDIGHGPFSHVYDGNFRKQLRRAEEKGSWLGRKFDAASTYKKEGVPEAMDGWAHEDASLMMIDAMLRWLGLEVDESDLDGPLRQVGDGIDANCFGLWDRSAEPAVEICYGSDDDDDDESSLDGCCHNDTTPLPSHLVLTSRDILFIKECIVGGPLPPKGTSINNFKRSSGYVNAKLIGRPHVHKEFLYDVVSNRHSGLDVDKIDYLARDTLRAHGANAIADLLPKLTEKACVAWAACPNPSGCWKCRNTKPGDEPGKHLMICYHDSILQNMMRFFEQRYTEHQRVYSHNKTQRGNYMICDILLLAEPHFRLNVMDDGEDYDSPPTTATTADDNVPGLRLPISRAMVNAETYLELTDTVLDKILNSDDPNLRPARALIKRFRNHQIYERIDEQIIGEESWMERLWDMDEAGIVGEIMNLGDMERMSYDDDDGQSRDEALKEDDIIIDKRKIHHGMGDKNPVDFVRFLPKKYHRQLTNDPENLPTATQISGSGKAYRKPDFFLQKSVRVFCRSRDERKHKRLRRLFRDFIGELKRREEESENDRRGQYEFEVEECSVGTPTKDLNSCIAISQSPLPSASKTNGECEETSSQSNKRMRGLFGQVMAISGHE